MKRIIAAGALALAMCTGARADMIGGWDVTAKAADDGFCTAQYVYKDKDDGNAENAVTLLLGKAPDGTSFLVVSLAYSKWEWDQGETAEADFLIDSTIYAPAAQWEAQSKTNLLSMFKSGNALLTALGRGKQIVLRFDGDEDDEAEFRIPNAGQALGALQFCQSR
jgi:hypothetical protein